MAIAVRPLELVVSTVEPELQNGKIVEVTAIKRLAFPQASVDRSRAEKKISSGLETVLQAMTREMNLPALEARFVRDGETWVAKQRSAWRLDLPKTRAVLQKALIQNSLEVQAVLTSKPPKRTVQDFFKRGVRFYFGGGDSSFAGSPDFRVQNIVAASKQLDARYLERGAVFDFNKSITLSSKTGFVLGYVIRGNSLSKDIGGGLCQVSTTVWRAAYNAGLPMLERHQHSYRVAYYEPVGFEATVYAPSKNLRFRNDTSAPLWMQLEWDVSSGRLEMNLFGVAPERRVQISKPVTSNERPAPKDRFVPDAKVPLGEAKVVSGAEDGVEARINRVVRYNNGFVTRDRTFSRYIPWAAIYAVNPKDKRLRK